MPSYTAHGPGSLLERIKERTPQIGSVPVADADLAALLVAAAIGIQAVECGEWECEKCNAIRFTWWNASNALTREMRIEFQAHMRRLGIAFPDAPWEEVC